jgi:NADPH:quinone reductase-like Zn-dependent oxidoreductase
MSVADARCGSAYGALVAQGRVAKGDFVLLTAARSSVGIAAIEIVRAEGGVSIATAENGIIFEYGALAAEPTAYPLFAALRKHLTIKGYTLFEVPEGEAVRVRSDCGGRFQAAHR